MKRIELEVNIAGVHRKVVLLSPSGGYSYYILLDNIYQGHIYQLNGKWDADFRNESPLTEQHIKTLSAFIEAS